MRVKLDSHKHITFRGSATYTLLMLFLQYARIWVSKDLTKCNRLWRVALTKEHQSRAILEKELANTRQVCVLLAVW